MAELVMVGLLVVLVAMGLVGLVWVGPELAKGLVVTVSPAVVPAPVVTVTTGRVKGAAMEVRLVSGSGRRVLGTYVFEDGRRQPVITVRGSDGKLARFAASHREDGVWVYRRQGVERE